ncbi:MAG: 2,3-bisphosphoglycerate-dependent phosphoglycerate mutase [Actinomycetota bacterium]|jgi:probable phosphoglycerate mutase|nr:2,3-bisphosphoglycerate-dependent phosphoglycerate mutase [Actinomycetota bacterium]
MELLLIRHAEPVRIVDADGPADPPLQERGRMQAELLGEWLATEPLDAIWASPLRRARETAAAVAAHHGLELVIDDELAEFDKEATSYIPYEELKATRDDRFVAMTEGRLEDFDIDPKVFQDGVVAAIERVIEANPGRTVGVVCHGGVINAYLAAVLGIDRLLFFEPGYTSISRVAASRAGARSVVSLNELAHLRHRGALP